MIVFYEPVTNQVMAVFSGDTGSTVWQDQGYLRATVPLEFQTQVDREHTVVVTNNQVTAVTPSLNPVQPVLDREDPAISNRQSRIAELQAIPRSNWTTAELRELVELLAQAMTS